MKLFGRPHSFRGNRYSGPRLKKSTSPGMGWKRVAIKYYKRSNPSNTYTEYRWRKM